MPDPDRTDVVTAFIQDDSGRILLLRRSEAVRTYPNQWGGVSGYLETTDPLLQAEREIRQETGLDRNDLELVRKGNPAAVDDPTGEGTWRVHPFLFHRTNDGKPIVLSQEHRDYEWVEPDRLSRYETVPDLEEVLRRTRP